MLSDGTPLLPKATVCYFGWMYISCQCRCRRIYLSKMQRGIELFSANISHHKSLSSMQLKVYIYNLQYTICNVQSAMYNLQCTICNIQSAYYPFGNFLKKIVWTSSEFLEGWFLLFYRTMMLLMAVIMDLMINRQI